LDSPDQIRLKTGIKEPAVCNILNSSAKPFQAQRWKAKTEKGIFFD
jgi:hypothetical protein